MPAISSWRVSCPGSMFTLGHPDEGLILPAGSAHGTSASCQIMFLEVKKPTTRPLRTKGSFWAGGAFVIEAEAAGAARGGAVSCDVHEVRGHLLPQLLWGEGSCRRQGFLRSPRPLSSSRRGRKPCSCRASWLPQRTRSSFHKALAEQQPSASFGNALCLAGSDLAFG